MKAQILADHLTMISRICDKNKEVFVDINGQKHRITAVTLSNDNGVVLKTNLTKEQMLIDIYRYEFELLLRDSDDIDTEHKVKNLSEFFSNGGHNELDIEEIEEIWINRFGK
jgi:hypothetical protein